MARSRTTRETTPAATGQAAGLLWGAHEAGLRECWRRIHAARLAAAAVKLTAPAVAVGAGSGGLFERPTPALTVARGVAVVDVVGPLSKGADLYNWLFGTLTFGQLAELVDAARRDVRVTALMLRVDSPGGTVAGVSDLVEAVAACRAAKPVVAAVSDLAASCAYQVAAQAGLITVDTDGWVGSIGVYLVIDDLSRLYEDLGVAVRVFASERDPYKGGGTPGTPISPEQADDWQRMVDEMGTEMIRSIFAGRAALRTAALRLPDGRVYMGADAVARGLADAVASWPAVLAALQDGDFALERLVAAAR